MGIVVLIAYGLLWGRFGFVMDFFRENRLLIPIARLVLEYGLYVAGLLGVLGLIMKLLLPGWERKQARLRDGWYCLKCKRIYT